ncbi:HNH endonuclease [Methylophilus sp.]|jgi:putative restriction endonuclease|uniref:HNH endonuclease n=1 Tax=Methylophilus sp. TaxID=29541 RepID=UPI0011D7C81F|nr:HNH endonuclease [Methylophilus sp.]TXI46493.1 MAG: HNH endonuclease [Methylophilus sp.]
MNQLQKAIIEKTGHDFGFEYLVSETDSEVTLGSARHGIHTAISLVDGIYNIGFQNAKANFIAELNRDFAAKSNDLFNAQGESQLALLLQRVSQLANSLPNQAVDNYETELKTALALIPPSAKGTEVERMVRQRIGQYAYRKAMLDYWGNACAVTGLQLPEVLKASHAKPWAECETDAERLDVYNGFLLTANLDALFDRFLISFDENGLIIISKAISDSQRDLLNIRESMQLRWVTKEHESYLIVHRFRFYQSDI